MAKLGNQTILGTFPNDKFAGNGSATAFTLSRVPGSVTSIDVYISGVKQDTSAYGVDGTTLTFTSAPPAPASNVTNNIEVCYRGVVGSVNAPADGTINRAAQVADTTLPYTKLDATGQKMLAKAWVRFAGAGPTIHGSYNVSSITKVSVGIYTVNFANKLPDTNYSANATAAGTTAVAASYVGMFTSSAGANPAPTTASFTFTVVNNGGYADTNYVNVSVFGN